MKKKTKEILQNLGFDDEVENIDHNLCPFCKSDKIKYSDFKDSLSWSEFKKSSMCQCCQDKLYE